MSLLERVTRLSDTAQKTEASSQIQDALRLRERVQDIVSADEIAALLRESPEQARNEIRSASRRVLDEPEWALHDETSRKRMIEDVVDAVFGFGPIEGLLDDDRVTEVMVNGAHSVFYERDGKLYASDQTFVNDEQVRVLIDRILGPLGRRIDESSPFANARLAQGHRVHAVIPPLALDGPLLTIRKFAAEVLTLDMLVEAGSIDETLQTFLVWAVLMRKNIAVSGGTGSGKTTLLNALSCVIPHGERIITIEDSAELRFLEHPHVVRLEARPKNAEGQGEITIRDLVINALRMRPDRIVVGECRGAEALDMLQAMTTGHDGSLTTLHANTPREVISRLTTMVRYAADLPVDVVETYIASAINVVVQTARAADGSRYVSNVVSFSYNRDERCCQVQPLFFRSPALEAGTWQAVPAWIDDLCVFGLATEKEVTTWKQHVSSLRRAS